MSVRRTPAFPVVLGGAALAIAAAFAALAIGVLPVRFADVAAALLGREIDATARTLVLEMRLPRVVGALCVGSALGAAGCMLQALLRNPLASPSVIGTAQAAGFGKVAGVLVGLSYAGSLGLSFVAATLAALLVLALSRTRWGLPTDTVVLTGLNLSLLFGALIGLTQFLSRDEGQLGRMMLLLLGGLWQSTWPPLAIVGPATAAALALSFLFARHLDLLALGEADAHRLGVRVRHAGTIVLLLACLLTSLAVCVAGVVAFVGLVVPHAARRIVGPAHAALFPASAALGAVLVVATDTLARTVVPPNELPLGVVTSLLGVPTFLFLLRALRAKGSGR